MKLIITFLGNHKPVPTTYLHQGVEYTGGVFAEALGQFCEYDRMLVCATQQAAEKTWPALQRLANDRIVKVDIPTGTTTDEMWSTFRTITERVPENCDVTFDITHGLRSLPFLVFLFAAYLKAAKGVTIDAIYYGALELRKEGGPAPVIDLSEFVTMLDWITATERFTHTGNGDLLSDMLRQRMPPGPEVRRDQDKREVKRALEQLAQVIDKTSAALAVTHPLETMAEAANLDRLLNAASGALDRVAPPFVVLKEQVRQTYAPFALPESWEAARAQENLRIQRGMVEWYVRMGQYVQAATLAREWMVSLVIWLVEAGDLFNMQIRKTAENSLNNLLDRRSWSEPRPPLSPNFNGTPAFDRAVPALKPVWATFAGLRNDLAHCGMDIDKARKAKAVKVDLEKVPGQLAVLARELLGVV